MLCSLYTKLHTSISLFSFSVHLLSFITAALIGTKCDQQENGSHPTKLSFMTPPTNKPWAIVLKYSSLYEGKGCQINSSLLYFYDCHDVLDHYVRYQIICNSAGRCYILHLFCPLLIVFQHSTPPPQKWTSCLYISIYLKLTQKGHYIVRLSRHCLLFTDETYIFLDKKKNIPLRNKNTQYVCISIFVLLSLGF